MKWTAISLLALFLACTPGWAQREHAAAGFGMAGPSHVASTAGVNGRSFGVGVRGSFHSGFRGEHRRFDRFGNRFAGYYWPAYYPGYFGGLDPYWAIPDEPEAPLSQQPDNQPSVIVVQAAQQPAQPEAVQPPKLIEVPLNKPAQGDTVAATKPSLPTIFVLTDGQHLQAKRYVLTVDGVRLQQGTKERIIPLSALNLDATLAANHAQGIDLQIPENRNEITLGF